jgi:hypothetical protein
MSTQPLFSEQNPYTICAKIASCVNHVFCSADVQRGKTPALTPTKRALLDSIDVSTRGGDGCRAVQVMAAGEGVTTKLYDRTNDEIIHDEVEPSAI